MSIIFGIILTDLSTIENENTKLLHETGFCIFSNEGDCITIHDPENLYESDFEEIRNNLLGWSDIKYYVGFSLSANGFYESKLSPTKEKELTSIIESELTPLGIRYFHI